MAIDSRRRKVNAWRVQNSPTEYTYFRNRAKAYAYSERTRSKAPERVLIVGDKGRIEE
jgi:hypothetical protein